MATENVTIPGSYTLTKRDQSGTTVTQYVQSSLVHIETRPDRVRTRKPTGWLYPKAYSVDVSTRRRPVGAVRTQTTEGSDPSKKSYYDFVGDLGSLIDAGFVPSLMSASSNERRKSQLEALTKLKDQRVNLGVMYAEANRTASFVGTVATKLARAAMHAKNKDFKRALGQLGVSNYRNYPKGWLGYQYAAKPLLQDVYGSLEALKSRSKFDDWVVTVKGVSVVRENTTVFAQTQTNHPGTRHQITEQRFRGYFTRLDYIPTNDFLAYASSLGVTNPAEVLWELVPFSFVVDWLVPVGEWFSTMDAALGYTFLSGSTTERLETIRQWRSAPGPAMSSYPYGVDLGSKYEGKARRFKLTRTVHASSPLVTLPRVKNPLSLGHMANGLSLLSAVFGSRR